MAYTHSPPGYEHKDEPRAMRCYVGERGRGEVLSHTLLHIDYTYQLTDIRSSPPPPQPPPSITNVASDPATTCHILHGV